MKERTSPSKPVVLSESTQRQLGTYALIASASGVAVLSLTQSAEGKVVYTPTYVKARLFQPLPIDLNHDGTIDFYLEQWQESSESVLSACQYWEQFASSINCSRSSRGTNAMRATRSQSWVGAALKFGDKIQKTDKFKKSTALLGRVVDQYETPVRWYGPWMDGGKGLKHRYLGLKFRIKGRTHFGWARLTIATTANKFTTTLTGYAYETIPGKPIIAGKTKGPDVMTLPMDTGTLGHLAVGRR